MKVRGYTVSYFFIYLLWLFCFVLVNAYCFFLFNCTTFSDIAFMRNKNNTFLNLQTIRVNEEMQLEVNSFSRGKKPAPAWLCWLKKDNEEEYR